MLDRTMTAQHFVPRAVLARCAEVLPSLCVLRLSQCVHQLGQTVCSVKCLVRIADLAFGALPHSNCVSFHSVAVSVRVGMAKRTMLAGG